MFTECLTYTHTSSFEYSYFTYKETYSDEVPAPSSALLLDKNKYLFT